MNSQVALACLCILFSILLFALVRLNQLSHPERNLKTRKQKKKTRALNAVNHKKKFSCAFFHPNCSSGGGGERTLWAALISLKDNFTLAQVTIFTKANVKNQFTVAEIKRKAMDDFNLSIPDDFQIIPLKSVFLAEGQTWPRFTLLGQIIGSIIVGFEAMTKNRPDLFIDTSGFPFIYPIIKLFNCRIIAYVHYPFMSEDMIQNLKSKSCSNLSLKSIIQYCKGQYYQALMRIYKFSGMFCNLALTNSTWTNSHMKNIWQSCPRINIVYPPCDLNPFCETVKIESPKNGPIHVISLSQFRPEKNHRLQVEIAAQVLKQAPEVKFIFIGGCRGFEDEERVKDLKLYAKSLGIDDSIEFLKNLPFDEMIGYLKRATIGLHTMRDEHFGIGIVELMAAGLITVAHNSGGPRADIVKKDSGFLCTSASEYSQTILKIIEMTSEERLKIAQTARRSVLDRFCGRIFSKLFSESVKTIINEQ